MTENKNLIKKREMPMSMKTKLLEQLLSKFLLITFTDAAAKEMRTRLAGAFLSEGYEIDPEKIQAMTFNAFFMNLIKTYHEELGYDMIPTVIDVNPTREAAKALHLVTGDNKIPGLNYGIPVEMNSGVKGAQGALVIALEVFNLIRSNNIDVNSPDALPELIDVCREFGIYKKVTDQSLIELMKRYDEYNHILKSEGLITFADQEPLGIKVLDMFPDYLNSLGFEHIVVDEFQDSNDVNMEFIRRLEKCRDIYGGTIKSIMVIGDDAQSIYGFRNANVENMTNFEDKIQSEDGVTRLFMSQNYRSYSEITDVANALIKNNKNRVDKELIAAKGKGGKFGVRGFYDMDAEIDYVIEKINKIRSEQVPVLDDDGNQVLDENQKPVTKDKYELSDFAIIAPTKKILQKYAAKFTKAGLDWVMMAPVKLSENSRVKAAMALCDAFYDKDATQSYFEYLVALYDGKIREELTDEQISEAIESLRNEWGSFESLDPNYAKLKFHEALEAIEHGDEIYRKWLDMLYDEEKAQAQSPEEELYYGVQFVKNFKRFGKDTEAKMDARYNGIVLTTAHSSKGLEYPVTFNTVTDFDNAFLHNARNIDALEEKRRLLFVSITRAMKESYVVGQYVAYKKEEVGDVYNQFLKEIFEIVDPSLKSYVPVDPMKAIREEERRQERNRKAREKNAARRAALLASLEGEKVYSTEDLKKSKLRTNYGQKKTSTKPAARSRQMTKEEVEQYDRLTKGANQLTLEDILAM